MNVKALVIAALAGLFAASISMADINKDDSAASATNATPSAEDMTAQNRAPTTAINEDAKPDEVAPDSQD